VSDKVDIYDDRGKLLESNVDIKALAPTRNPAIKKIITDTKRSVAISVAGIQGKFRTD
jgi:methyl-coenzyme M reductase beta subunit